MSVQPDERFTQDNDNTPYFSYFDFLTQLGFVWDGKSDHIDVTKGGMSEPIIDKIPAPPAEMVASPEVILQTFKAVCDFHVEVKKDDWMG